MVITNYQLPRVARNHLREHEFKEYCRKEKKTSLMNDLHSGKFIIKQMIICQVYEPTIKRT